MMTLLGRPAAASAVLLWALVVLQQQHSHVAVEAFMEEDLTYLRNDDTHAEGAAFISAMAGIEKDQRPEHAAEVEQRRQEWLHELLLQEAVLAPAGSDGATTPLTRDSRVLDEEAGDDAYANNADDASSSSSSSSRRYYGGTSWMADYSLKYVGCQNVHSWNDDHKEEDPDSSLLVMDRFVVLRLCPKNSCSSLGKYGCAGNNYGEYLIPMGIYLNIMQRYHFAAIDEYCDVCDRCMNMDSSSAAAADDGSSSSSSSNNMYMYDSAYQVNQQAYNNKQYSSSQYSSNKYSSNDNANNNNGGNRRTQQYSYSNGGYNSNSNNNNDSGGWTSSSSGSSMPWYADPSDGTCIFQDICKKYKSTCNKRTSSAYLKSYFFCNQVTLGTGEGLYAAPHCASDGHDIELAVYSDYMCSTYVEKWDTYMKQYNAGGMDIHSYQLNEYTKNACFSCLASNEHSLTTDTSDAKSVSQVCSAIHQISAKCNDHMSHAYSSYQQVENQDSVCHFIDSLLENSYNAYGDADVRAYGVYASDMMRVTDAGRLSAGLISGLVLSVGLVAFLFMYMVHLRRQIIKRILLKEALQKIQIGGDDDSSSNESSDGEFKPRTDFKSRSDQVRTM